MLKGIFKDEEGSIIAEYERDGIAYVTMLFSNREQNFIPKSEVTLI